MNLEEKQKEITEAYDDPNKLSQIVIELASYMIPLSYEISNAELKEAQSKESFRTSLVKVTIAETEDHALIETGNKYGHLKIQFDAIRELINAVKTRINVLSWERTN